jgi:hypothetical protein
MLGRTEGNPRITWKCGVELMLQATGARRRRALLLAGLLAVTGSGLGGCLTTTGTTTPTETQSAQDFVTAVNTLAQAESDYFDQIQTASDAVHRLDAISNYVAHHGQFASIYAALQKRDDFSKAKKLRTDVMAQLQNYATQVNAIASGSTASWLGDSTVAIGDDVTALAKDAAAVKLSPADVGLVEKGVTDLGSDIIAHKSAQELQKLAQDAQTPISAVATMIADDNANIENDNYAIGLVADQETDLEYILKSIYDDPHATTFARFNAVLAVGSWKTALITKGQDIAAALKKLQAANDAMAKGATSSDVSTLWQQATALATQALNASPGK